MKNGKNRVRRFILNKNNFFLFTLLVSNLFYSQDSSSTEKKDRIQVRGFLKDMQSVFFTDNAKSVITGNFIHNRVNLRWNILENLHLRAEVRNRIYYGEQVKTTYQFGKYIDTDNGIVDLSCNFIDDTSVVANTTLDRVLLNWSNQKLDITLGRQRINWGINLVWNPNDIFNAFNYFDFDYEERPGTDAVRMQYSTGKVSSIELAYKLSDKEKQQVGALMYKTNFKKFDWQNFGGIYFEDLVIGTGWAGSIKKTGFLGEASYFHPYKKMSDTIGSLIASVSFDRTFKGDYFIMASYLYNSNGKDISFGAADFSRVSLSAKNLMPFEHTFFIQITKSFNPLVSAGLSGMFSPAKSTVIVFPTLSVSLSDNWDLSLFAQSFFSDVNDVYRSLGNSVYLRLRWSY